MALRCSSYWLPLRSAMTDASPLPQLGLLQQHIITIQRTGNGKQVAELSTQRPLFVLDPVRLVACPPTRLAVLQNKQTTMSATILNLWSSGKIESHSLVGLLAATDAFTAALAISTWAASSQSWISGAVRFYLVWTSFLTIAAAAALTAFIVHLPLRTEMAFGVVLASIVFTGQILLTWAVQYARALPAAFTAVSVFAAFLVFTLHGAAGVLYYSRHNLLPTVFNESAVPKSNSASNETLPPA